MTLPQHYFDELYSTDDDPWSFRTRRYEVRKRALTLHSLLEERYALVFEPGCSIGVLTAQLAARADAVIAMDTSAAALDLARPALPDHVELRHGSLPGDWPEGPIDLVVLSEVLYYLDRSDCIEAVETATAQAREIVAVHWRHPVEDYPLSGDEVHGWLQKAAERAGWARAVQHMEEDFRLDVWTSGPASVARRTGVLS